MMSRPVINILAALVLGQMASCDATPLPIPPEMDYELMTLEDDPAHSDSVLLGGPTGTASPVLRFTIQDISTLGEPVEISLDPDGSFSQSVEGTRADYFRVRVFHRNNWIHLFDCRGEGVNGVALLPDQDADLDGYTVIHDCNDADPGVNPGTLERCGDRLDNDCDGLVDEADCV